MLAAATTKKHGLRTLGLSGQRRKGMAGSGVLIQNDLAVLRAMEGNFDEAREAWRAVLEVEGACLPARLNLGLIEAELDRTAPNINPLEQGTGLTPGVEGGPTGVSAPPGLAQDDEPTGVSALRRPVRIAVLSFLFNWPSTGGGNMHTAGLVDFLGRDGYDVRHFLRDYPAWGIRTRHGRRAGRQPRH